VDVQQVKEKTETTDIETPSWGYANSGTRFKTSPRPGPPGPWNEKLPKPATCTS